MSAHSADCGKQGGAAAFDLPPTEVCLTVDVEFSVAGAFADPQRYRPISRQFVECEVGDRHEGLDFILDAMRRHGCGATFFVETLQSFYFGEEPMGRIAEKISRAGHDVELHLHPCWAQFSRIDWRTLQTFNDSCAAAASDDLREMIEFSIGVFSRWRLPPPIALRTGGFSCNRAVHRAMTACDLTLGSNIALASYRPSDTEFHVYSGSRVIDDVLEVPVLTYASPRLPIGATSGLRILAITAASWPEMENLLWRARRAGVSPVVILTHPSEFVKKSDFRYRELRRDRVNRHRLERLLDFIDQRDEFETTTFARSARTWVERGGQPGELLRVPAHLAAARIAQNLLNSQVWRY